MPNTRSAAKRVRQAERRRLRNKMYRSRVRTAIKRVRQATTPEQRQEALRRAMSLLDRAAAKGIFHRNKSRRLKSRLCAFVQKLETAGR